MGHKKAQEITTEAANRGTKMHSFLETFVKTNEVGDKPSNPFHAVSWAMAKSVISRGLINCNEYWGVEVPLYFPKVYAGTTDCVGIHNNTESIIDFKQTNKPKKREWIEDYFLQTVFYGTAHNEVHGTKIQKGVIMMCVNPQLDSMGNLINEPDYLEFIIEGSEWAHYENKMWKRLEEYYSQYI